MAPNANAFAERELTHGRSPNAEELAALRKEEHPPEEPPPGGGGSDGGR